MPLTATADPGHHHFATDVVYFYMKMGTSVFVAASPDWHSNSSSPILHPACEGPDADTCAVRPSSSKWSRSNLALAARSMRARRAV